MNFGAFSPGRLGFTVEKFLDLQQWRPLVLDATVPMTSVAACPADGVALRTLCTLVEQTGARRVRIGCCPECGHVTYIDRPAKAWVDSYYFSMWDAHSLAERINHRQQKLAKKLPGEKTGVKIVVGLEVDRRRPVCEIGCGYGANLKHLANAGFTQLIGTEASEHRAEVVRRVFGFEVFTAPFESAETQRELTSRAPFSIIFSHHVLEHTYHPDQIVAAASQLQRSGDYLIISVPRHEGEPSMGVLLFLPHLHSFTRASLERLAARFGYELVDDSRMHAKNVNLAFRKADVAAMPARVDDAFERAIDKYVRTLDLRRRRFGTRRLWWNRRADQAGQVSMFGNGWLEAHHWNWLARRRGYENHRSVMITNLRRRFTSMSESPLEIQFRGELTLLYK